MKHSSILPFFLLVSASIAIVPDARADASAGDDPPDNSCTSPSNPTVFGDVSYTYRSRANPVTMAPCPSGTYPPSSVIIEDGFYVWTLKVEYDRPVRAVLSCADEADGTVTCNGSPFESDVRLYSEWKVQGPIQLQFEKGDTFGRNVSISCTEESGVGMILFSVWTDTATHANAVAREITCTSGSVSEISLLDPKLD
ncbi:hypothetical protein C7S18_04890 [Ahniella affigens]|uniref:Ig-like domain-containing protein n=1 Tax=Ahniella affigens TaxID=2021234 RepID=A0A2P1PP08_9GAMM|nr:hypothetical protein [Ahniella affigens]AVP96578.1 hypothetical protein C7S18_04890 [Ahniella affigens]